SIAGSGAIDDLCYIAGVTNLPPDAVDDETIGFQNIPVVFDVLSNDSDPDMDPLEVTGAQVDDPADGTVVVNPDNTLTFTPDPLTTGTVTITYDISDGNGGTDSAVLSILIIPNANPTIQEPVSFSVDENELFVGNLRAVDPEFDPLTWSIIGDQDDDLFSVDPLTGELNFLAAPDFEDPEDTDGDNQYLLTVRVADEFGSDEHLILVTVLDLPDNPNTPPVATNDETFGFQDTALTFDVLSNDFDPDMDTLEVTGAQVDDPADGEVVINADDTLTFTPDRLTTGPVTITYDISDGNGGTDSAVFTIFVIPNANPTIQEPVSFSVLENELFVGNLRAVDAELDLLTWSIIGSQDDDLFSVDAMTGELAFLDAPDFENPADTDGDNEYLLTVQVADEFGTDQHQILVTVLELG
ncbi:MAG: Ig-like domain-containing protein, partial [Pseudomonadota bacterium]